VEKKFNLTINPDPRSLWKNLPSDPALPFAKPDNAFASLDADDLRWLGASRRGRSHAHEAKPRDDDFSFHRLTNGWHVAIASDGAGSAKFSRRGSQLACEITLKWLAERLGDGLDSSVQAWFSGLSEDAHGRLKSDLYTLLGGAAFETHKRIAAEANQHGANTRDFNATYIAVIAKQFDAEWLVASFTIGDGGAGLLDTNGGLSLLSTPDSGEFAGQTVFVTMPSVFKDPAELMRRVHCHRVASLRMIVLMTDGVTDPKFETDANFENVSYWHILSDEMMASIDGADDSPAAADALLAWLDFWSPGNHDDRTVVLGLPCVSVHNNDTA
jgi:serine/threonine protein phosphatase PrpC